MTSDSYWETVSTLPHGHYLIRDVHVTQDIIDEPDWGNEEDEEMPTSPTWDELIGNDPVNTVSRVSRRAAECSSRQRTSKILHRKRR